MKILHTADLHLEKIEDNKWKCLKSLINISKEHKIDAMVISGDILDKDVRYNDIRGQLASLFYDLPFKVILIRGNHDEKNLDGQHLGDSTFYIRELGDVVIYDEKKREWRKIKFNDTEFCGPKQENMSNQMDSNPEDLIAFWGLPYEDGVSLNDIANKIRWMTNRATIFGTNILLHHGVLIGAEMNLDYEQEKANFYRYMPIRKENFKETPFQYVLAGHIHSKFQAFALPNDGVYVYPGSPYPIKSSEKGQRAVNIFEVKKSPAPYLLDSTYYIEHTFKITPAHRSLDEIIQDDTIFQDLLKQNCTIFVNLEGYFDGKLMNKEQDALIEEFKKYITKYGQRVVLKENFHMNLRDISKITTSPIYEMFSKKLDQRNFDPPIREDTMRLFIKAMMESKIEY